MNALLHLYPGDAFAAVAVSVLLQATVVILTAWLAARVFFRRHAAVRHGLWLAALILVLLSPVTAIVMEAANVRIVAVSVPEFLTADEAPADVVPVPSNNRGASNSAALAGEALPLTSSSGQPPIGDWSGERAGRFSQTFTSVEASPSAASSSAGQVAAATPIAAEAPAITPPAPGNSIAARLRGVAGTIFVIWLTGVIYGLVRLCSRGLALRRLVCMSQRGDKDERLRPILAQIERHLGLKRMPPVLLWRDRKLKITPLTIGIFRPVVMLSKSLLQTLSPEELREVLVHECAHVLRRDAAVGLLQRIALVLFWPYPLVLLLNRHLTLAREEVCDNYVLLHASGPQYAQTLFDLSERIHPLSPNLEPVGLFQHHCPLERRVAGLLDLRRNVMTKINRWAALGMAMVFLTIALAAAGARISKAAPKGGITGSSPIRVPKVQKASTLPAMTSRGTAAPIHKLSGRPASQDEKRAALAEEKTPAKKSDAIQRRAVNKLVQDFSENVDLSTPESALAEMLRRYASKNMRGIEELSWTNWPKQLGVDLKEIEESLRNDPHVPPDFRKMILESEILEVLTYRDELAEVIVTSKWLDDGPYKAYCAGKVNGVWKNMTFIENTSANTEDFQNYFEKNKETQWSLFQQVKKDVGDSKDGKTVVALRVLPPEEKKTAPGPEKKDVGKPASIQRRAVNKLVMDFPEKVDLSTPESALAAYHRATAKKDTKGVLELGWRKYGQAEIDEIERFWTSDTPTGMDIYLQAVLDAEVLEVLTYKGDLAVVVSKLKFPEGVGRHPFTARAFGRIGGQWKNLGENRLPSLEAARLAADEKKELAWQEFERLRDALAGKPPAAKGGTVMKVPPDRYDAVKATTPDAETLLLMGLVENFFNHNAVDITARKSLEWGEVKKNGDGSRSIRYKFEARIWDKETMIYDRIFTFDKDNVMLSYKDADGPPVKKEPKKVDLETKEGVVALVEDFFAHNFRDVTSRETVEWGDIEKDKDGNTSIRYKYVATIWDKDQQIMNQIFTFDKKGEFVRYKNVEGFPQKMEKKEEKPTPTTENKSV